MWHLHCIKLHLITSGNGQPASPKIIPKYPCTNTSIRSASCSFCLKSVVSTASAETSAAALKPTPVATSAARFNQTLVDMRPPREGRKLSNVAVQFQNGEEYVNHRSIMHVSYNERISGKIKERYSTILYISCTTCSSNQGCTTFPF